MIPWGQSFEICTLANSCTGHEECILCDHEFKMFQMVVARKINHSKCRRIMFPWSSPLRWKIFPVLLEYSRSFSKLAKFCTLLLVLPLRAHSIRSMILTKTSRTAFRTSISHQYKKGFMHYIWHLEYSCRIREARWVLTFLLRVQVAGKGSIPMAR